MKKIYRLGDIANISAGQGAPQKESDFSDVGNPFIRAGNLAKLIEGYSEYDVCDLINDDTAKKYGLRLYPKDTIVFAKSGMSTSKGYVHILSQECYIVNHLACINIYNNDSSYMKYYFMYHKPNKLIKDEAYPSISLADIRGMKINIHDIQTQKEIVAVLDKVTSLISMRKEQLEKLDILVKSKFIEMFGDPVLNPKGWEKKKLGEVLKSLTTGLNPRQFFKLNTDDAKNYYVTIKELKSGTLVFNSKTDMVNDEALKLINGRSNLEKDDVLFTGTGTIGETYILKSKPNNWNIKEGVYSLKPMKEHVIPYYLKTLFAMDNMKKEYSKFIVGGTVKSIPMRDLHLLIIPIPPIDLQNQFAEFVEQVEKNKENIKLSLNQLETLYNALMQEYFG